MREEIIDFLQHGSYTASHVDQHFLRKRIWPTARHSVLAHDSQFDFPGNQPFPIVPGAPLGGIHHIGANQSAGSVEMQCDAPDGGIIDWSILQRDGTVFCTYEGVVQGGVCEVSLPDFLRGGIKSGELVVRVHRRE
jgi:hypothetical protein